MNKKEEVIADASKFQRVCASYVRRNVIYCVSALIYELREVADELDDYDTYVALTAGKPDYEEAAYQFVMNDADLEDLEAIVEENGYWTDLTTKVAAAFPNLLRHYEVTYTQRDSDGDDEDDFYCWAENEEHAIERCVNAYPTSFNHVVVESTTDDGVDTGDWCERNPGLERALREAVWKLTDEASDGPEWVCNHFDLEPEYGEIYEHWIVDRYFGKQLIAAGEIVEEYMGLTVWGRTTTGQAIYMDGVIEQIVSGLDGDHWVWKEA